TAIAVGIALQEGYINSVNDPIDIYLHEELAGHQDKKDITIEQLLTMRSGIYFDNDKETDIYRKHIAKSSVEYVLGRDLTWDPGTHFQYNDGAPQLVSAIIQNSTGMTLEEYTDLKFFSKIGLKEYDWKLYSDGITLGAFGLMMSPRELAKIAQCVCDSGRWNNQQIVPKDWIDQMLALQVTDVIDNNEIGFGYYWWLNKSKGFVFMWGHGGQYAITYPEKGLVIVITALEQLSGDFTFPLDDIISIADRIQNISN
ncbi:serine hydrolase domain-containing protein, partial [Bacteroidota bacterium]